MWYMYNSQGQILARTETAHGFQVNILETREFVPPIVPPSLKSGRSLSVGGSGYLAWSYMFAMVPWVCAIAGFEGTYGARLSYQSRCSQERGGAPCTGSERQCSSLSGGPSPCTPPCGARPFTTTTKIFYTATTFQTRQVCHRNWLWETFPLAGAGGTHLP